MSTLRLTNALIRGYLRKNGWESTPGELELLGLRGCVPQGVDAVRLVEDQPNQYNDTLVVYGPVLALFRGTVDPGRAWTVDPAHKDGCAHLLNGQHWYQRGLHRGHPALVQAAGVSIWRDKDRDGKRDPAEFARHKQWIGLNIHAMGTGPEIDEWSAGCQGIRGGWNGDPWRTFLAHIERHPQRRYRYTLCDAAGFQAWVKAGAV